MPYLKNLSATKLKLCQAATGLYRKSGAPKPSATCFTVGTKKKGRYNKSWCVKTYFNKKLRRSVKRWVTCAPKKCRRGYMQYDRLNPRSRNTTCKKMSKKELDKFKAWGLEYNSATGLYTIFKNKR